MTVGRLVELVAHPLPPATEACGAAPEPIGRVAGDPGLRAGVGALGLDPVPVEVRGRGALGDRERGWLPAGTRPDECCANRQRARQAA